MAAKAYIYNKVCLWLNLLISRHERLHDRPGDEISHSADTEYDHVSGWFSLEAHEGERGASFLGIVKEDT